MPESRLAQGRRHKLLELQAEEVAPAGSYEISSRATLIDGTTQTSFAKATGNFRKLKLK